LALDAPIVESDEAKLRESVVDERVRTAFEVLQDKDLREEVGTALALLNERDRVMPPGRSSQRSESPALRVWLRPRIGQWRLEGLGRNIK
jgi:hypothetical protein